MDKAEYTPLDQSYAEPHPQPPQSQPTVHSTAATAITTPVSDSTTEGSTASAAGNTTIAIGENGVGPGAAVTTGANTLKINVKTLTGMTIVVELPAAAPNTVADIKTQIESQQGVPPHFQRLIFSGRELADEQTLAAGGVTNNAVVHLVLRQNDANAHGAAVNPNEQNNAQALALAGVPIDFNLPVNIAPPAHDPVRVFDAARLQRFIKLFAVIDGVFLLIWSVMRFYWPLAVGVCLAASGYYGAVNYKAGYVALYVLYLIASIGFRCYLIYMAEQATTMLILGVGVLVGIYVLNLTCKFLLLIRRLTEADKAELRAMQL